MLRRYSLRFAVAAMLLAPAAVRAGSPNALTPAENRAGWQLLFDGQSTAGWRNYKKEGISDGWKVEDGALVRAANGAGDIVSENQYDNFELSLEFKVEKGGNSGVMFRVGEGDGPPWHTGPEIQINDHVNGHDPVHAGWLYQLYQPKPDGMTGKTVETFRGHDTWNEIYLRIAPNQCEICLNGVRYAQFQLGSKDWNNRVAESKFKDLANFAKLDKGHICLQDHGNLVSFRNIKVRELPADGSVPDPIDGELPVKAVPAFPGIKWAGWDPVDADGKNVPLRPIVLTHAGDHSDRIFVATQQGVVHVFDEKTYAAEGTRVFLDIQDRVAYSDRTNEEGLLGFAFHPQFEQNGQCFIYYTSQHAPHTSIISRFTARKDGAGAADPGSEEEIMRIEQPFWNHNGGTIAFGPDGKLYIALGDGGSGNDPFGNGQNLGTLLGSVLRIDVDHKDDGLGYAIPRDNPFVGQEGARPEIYAHGVRNLWRIAFDRQTGDLWAGEVGQNLWEEILLIKKGGNYGWNLREGSHPFGDVSADDRTDLIEPVWEYDHQIGKSITGGTVYRGKQVPQLVGKYLYADYVSGKIWALDYDVAAGQVRGNYAVPSDKMPVISFGEDEMGEVYFMIVSPNGQGIYKFEGTGQAALRAGRLQQRIVANLSGPFQEVVQSISEASGVPITIDGNALKDAGLTRNMRVKVESDNVAAAEVLQRVFDSITPPTPAKRLCLCLRPDQQEAIVTTESFAKSNGWDVFQSK